MLGRVLMCCCLCGCVFVACVFDCDVRFVLCLFFPLVQRLCCWGDVVFVYVVLSGVVV